MNKAIFIYKKDDGTQSERRVINPLFLKESSNTIKSFEAESVKYIRGYEIDKTGLSEEDITEYEETLIDYFELEKPTIQEFFTKYGLDPKKVQEKSFKKEGVSALKIID